MNFNTHSDLEGKHALLGASQYHWINYTPEQVIDKYRKQYIQAIGTATHEFAAKRINYGFKLTTGKQDKMSYLMHMMDQGIPENVIDIDYIFPNLVTYVNDAIGFKMTPEQVLFYSYNCFGTADAISFRKNELRIHDLKTGIIPAHIEQLEIYVALFCLEYDVKPADIYTELRIYQGNQVLVHKPEVNEIVPLIDKIKTFDAYISKYKEGDLS